MKIAIVGTGYVGLVAGTCFADSGNEVVCVDRDPAKIEALQAGRLPIYEPGLEDLVRRNAREGRLFFTRSIQEAVPQAEVVFLAVGTPEGESGDADLRYVLAAAEEVGRALRQYTVVVDKSTVPVGTAEKVKEVISGVTSVPFDVVSNPEFLKEGAALDDFLKPDRVVVGSDSPRARALMGELYAPFVRTENPILYMDTRAAELTKYAANAMLATRISFMNDVAALCDALGADVDQVRRGMGADRRIGYPFLFPGVGYGGSCFPKDVRALDAMAREAGLELELFQAVERTNARQKAWLLQQARRHFKELAGRTFAVWGLSFKPKTDDIREAPAIELIEGLVREGAHVRAYDPAAIEPARRRLGTQVAFSANPYEALNVAEALFVVTEWNEFRHPDLVRMRNAMKNAVIFDGRNVYDPARMRASGFVYYGVGRGNR